MTFAAPGAGTVITETLRLPQASTVYNNSFSNFLYATRQVATDAGYAPAQFDFDIICTSNKPSAIFGGISYVGGPGMWIANANFNVGVVGHELGHNLGLPHASFWYTGDQSVIGPGVKQEYGDIFDSMGTPGGSTSHFNARFKTLLGWISEADALWISANGTFRIAAHDQPTATGPRALRIVRNSLQNYWIEFRQSFSNLWITNGVAIRWAGNDATNTLLLDTTPGTPSATQDSPVLIGHTFSDRCVDLHITPIGKGGTTPETLDVVINRGPFPENVPPTITVTPSASNVATGEVVTLQASAADGNGDALAYGWDFGDGTFGENQPVVQHAWTRDGDYVARCTVTDMKGGTASASTIVRAGTVTTFTVGGRVLKSGAPAEGVLVKAGSRFSYTDSDGTYRITRLNAGRQTMSAILEQYNVLNAGFENPITIGSNTNGLDFAVLPDSLNAVSLVATNAVWKYLDTGATPGIDWTTIGFNDSAWKEGPAKLGYGAGGERTVVGYGPNPLNRYITTWFRRAFVVGNAAVIDHIVFRLRRDDGAVVYLNGSEVYRENLPAGAILPGTTASIDVGSVEEQTFFKRVVVLPSGLVTGSNMVAVEVHQFATNSLDLSFDLELLGMSDNPAALRPLLASQQSDAGRFLFWPALYNGWFIYSAPTLTAGAAWNQSSAATLRTNGSNMVVFSASDPSGFFQLRKPGFCAP